MFFFRDTPTSYRQKPPPPAHVMTAARWRRLPCTRMSVWSGARPRRLAGRTIVAASLIGCLLTLKEGTAVRNWLVRSISPWLASSSAGRTSTGTADSVTDRGWARLPTTTTSSWSCTDISISRVTVAPAVSSARSRTTVVKLGRLSYTPGGNAILYLPLLSVNVVRRT